MNFNSKSDNIGSVSSWDSSFDPSVSVIDVFKDSASIEVLDLKKKLLCIELINYIHS